MHGTVDAARTRRRGPRRRVPDDARVARRVRRHATPLLQYMQYCNIHTWGAKHAGVRTEPQDGAPPPSRTRGGTAHG